MKQDEELEERIKELEKQVEELEDEISDMEDEVNDSRMDLYLNEKEMDELEEKLEKIKSVIPNESLDDTYKIELLNEVWHKFTYETLKQQLEK